jgi:hypothetical protein
MIEAIYMENLPANMMISHCRGDLLVHIKNAIFLEDIVHTHFQSLCPSNTSETVCLNLLHYVLTRFAWMHGRWFEQSVQSSSKNLAFRNMAMQAQVDHTSKVKKDVKVASIMSKCTMHVIAASTNIQQITGGIISADDNKADSNAYLVDNRKASSNLDEYYKNENDSLSDTMELDDER